MIVSESVLTWPTIDAGLIDLPGISAAQITLANQLATDWLWSLTGRRLGTRVVQDRPATAVDLHLFRDYPSFLQSSYGWDRGWPFDSDPRTGQSSYRQILELPRDAQAILEITGWPAPGVTDAAFAPLMDPSLYRLEGNFLVRQDGGTWPQTQNMISELGRPDTWQITYTRGQLVPFEGQRCMGLLAVEFGKAQLGTKTKIPYNATSATRSGVTVQRAILDALKTTGVGEVDQWVASVNPNALQSPPRVWSPDLSRNQRPYMGSYAGGSATTLALLMTSPSLVTSPTLVTLGA